MLETERSTINKLEFNSLAQEFLSRLFTEAEEQGLEIAGHWDIDHLCYRVASDVRYKEMKSALHEFSELLIESDVNGRPISTFKLETPVQIKNWTIDLVELPAPKPSKPTAEGLEHLEVICDVPFSFLEKKYSHLNLDRGGLQKDFNQELEFRLDSSKGSCNLKFHHLSLESVIKLEKNKPIHQAVQNSKVLNSFQKYSPLIAGTFPLGIETQGSDIDILMQAMDLDQVEIEIANKFSTQPKYQSQRSQVDQLDTLIVNFDYEGVPFELFVQNKESVRQKAYLHFLVEERLLKIGGERFKNQIIALRRQGLKTEPAFALALGLEGDPYAALLKLQNLEAPALLRLIERFS